MGHLKTLALAGTASIAALGASAADLLPPQHHFAPPPPVVEVSSGVYLRGDVGVGILDFDKFEGVNVSSDPTFRDPPNGYRLDAKKVDDQVFVSVGLGYQFNAWLRADVTAEYRTAATLKTVESYQYPGEARGFNTVTNHLSTFVGLANAYVDLGTFHGITPFVGVGAGFAHHRLKGGIDDGITPLGYSAIGFGHDKNDTRFAWALHAGLGYHVTPNLKLELAYRYLNMGKAETQITCDGCTLRTSYTYKDIDSHDVKLGMRWLLAPVAPIPVAMAPEPMPMPGPLIRKY